MSQPHDVEPTMATNSDRREFLRRAALGATAVGAWVAPQVLHTGTAAAGCTPLNKMLQITTCTCAQVTPTGTDSNLSSCNPSGWQVGVTDAISFSCTPAGGNPCHGGSVTILGGCAPSAGKAIKFCPLASGTKYTCVDGVPSGASISFPYLTASERATGCIYVTYRIIVTCCT